MALPREALIGEELGSRYNVTRFIAPGGFCLVYEAHDQLLGHSVALKILFPNARNHDVVEFEQEGEFLDHLSNASHVVDLFETGTASIELVMPGSGAPFDLLLRYHALELADCCLTELLIDLPSLSWLDRLHLYRGVVKGAHQSDLSNIVHRDHKSENVLVFLSSETTADSKLADFGRGRLLTTDSHLDAAEYATGRGDRRFAPPEMLWGLGDSSPGSLRRAELYLLGSLFFEVATGFAITAHALGDPMPIVHSTQAMRIERRKQSFEREMPRIRAAYEEAYSIFTDEVPRVIRYDATRLLRELTNPDPSKRRPRRFDRARHDDGLSWILRRIDIMSLNLSRSYAEASRLAERKAGNAAAGRTRQRGTQ